MNSCVLRHFPDESDNDSEAVDARGANTAPRAIAAPSGGVGGNSMAQIMEDNCPDMLPAAGVVIENLDAYAGTWQFSLDEGQTWRAVRTDLINRPGCMGLALDCQARLRVLPFGGQRVQGARMVFHAVERAPAAGNGSYRPYASEDREDGTPSVTLVLSLGAINGRPPAVKAPRPRNKRAMLQRAAANQPQSGMDGMAMA